MSEQRQTRSSEPRKGPTSERLRELFHYDPETGAFVRRVRVGRYQVGEEAGSVSKVSGYREIGVDGRLYLAHRLAWTMVHGEPPKYIDHANGDRADNRIANLRAATNSQNMGNCRGHKDSAVPLKGVRRPPDYRRFKAEIMVEGRKFDLGLFDTAEEAHAAYVSAAKEYFGEFARAV